MFCCIWFLGQLSVAQLAGLSIEGNPLENDTVGRKDLIHRILPDRQKCVSPAMCQGTKSRSVVHRGAARAIGNRAMHMRLEAV